MRLTASLPIALAALAFATLAQAASVTASPYGTTAKGEPVQIYTLANNHGMEVKILSYGGIVTAIKVPDAKGKTDNVALNLKNLAAYEARANFNSLLGRVANRVSGGGFTLDGVRYPLTGSSAEGISSHGGPGGFGAKLWNAKPFEDAKMAGVVLTYVSADGENGYPGALSVTVTYTVNDRNELVIDYQATTDKPTVVNLSHHTYLNLAGGGTIDDHWLQVAADQWTPLSPARLPTGEIASVKGTPFDLRKGKRIADGNASTHPQLVLARGYDHNLALRKPWWSRFALAARLYDPVSGRLAELRTTEPGLQVFTANGFNGSLIDDRGRPLVRGAGVALETQHYPDSPNRPEFPSVVLRPGETFRSTTALRFSAPKTPPKWARP